MTTNTLEQGTSHMPPMLWDDDSPRARVTDPDTSQRAADKSQASRALVRSRVLHILAYQGRQLTGNQINDHYVLYFGRDVHFDSPRKRAGELVADGLAVRVEGVYHLTAKGIEEAGR